MQTVASKQQVSPRTQGGRESLRDRKHSILVKVERCRVHFFSLNEDCVVAPTLSFIPGRWYTSIMVMLMYDILALAVQSTPTGLLSHALSRHGWTTWTLLFHRRGQPQKRAAIEQSTARPVRLIGLGQFNSILSLNVGRTMACSLSEMLNLIYVLETEPLAN